MTAPNQALPAPPNVLSLPYDAGDVVEIGDLIYFDGTYGKTFDQLSNVNEADNQASVASAFVGVAVERKVATDVAGSVDVCLDWYGDMDCGSTTAVIGDLVAAKENTGATALENQVVKRTTDDTLSIGQFYESYASATTRARVRIQSTLFSYNANNYAGGS